MAKIKFGMMMTDARGKLGGHVFSKNRSGAFIRTKVTPSNAQTSRQTFIRQALAAISANWSALTQEARDSFDGAVSGFTGTNVFGDVQVPTGKTLYTKLNMNLVNSEQPLINTAPAKETLSPAILLLAENAGSDLSIALSESTVGSKIVVSATPAQTQGTSFYKGKYRQIGVYPGQAGLSLDVTDEYVAKFGTFNAADNISLQVIFVLPNGQATIPQNVKAREI